MNLVRALALTLLVAGFARAQPPNTLSPAELADGWILLFDGHSMFGWSPAAKIDWKIEDGALVAAGGEVGLLNTTSEFGNYELKVDFRAARGTNSGVFLRTSPTPKQPGSDCYELNIAPPDNPFPTGSFVAQQKVDGAGETDGWRTFHVKASAGHFTVSLDGKQVLDFTDENPLGRGYIGLQHNMGKVEFRNVKLKPLGLQSIFNGKDLSGWKVFDGDKQKSDWSVTDAGELRVKNGPGQLESAGKYADFTMQVEVKTNGKHLNSGIFFRSIPGQWWNGYESQIQNGFQDDDRTKPADFGTGGFYRRQPARKVVADDFQWFHKTVIAKGPRMAAWVNGYQVSDWVDTRKPHENPRNGLRTAAGTLILQGHDPTTDILFRNFRAAELPPRK